jgi:hypothetical protein
MKNKYLVLLVIVFFPILVTSIAELQNYPSTEKPWSSFGWTIDGATLSVTYNYNQTWGADMLQWGTYDSRPNTLYHYTPLSTTGFSFAPDMSQSVFLCPTVYTIGYGYQYSSYFQEECFEWCADGVSAHAGAAKMYCFPEIGCYEFGTYNCRPPAAEFQTPSHECLITNGTCEVPALVEVDTSKNEVFSCSFGSQC